MRDDNAERLNALDADDLHHAPIDKAGAGRYIICFLMAGLVGLAIQYGTRNSEDGWLGVKWCAGIFAFVFALFFLIGLSG